MNKAKKYRKLAKERDKLLLEIMYELGPYETGTTEDYCPVFSDGTNFATMYNMNYIDFNGTKIRCDNAYVEMFLRFNITM